MTHVTRRRLARLAGAAVASSVAGCLDTTSAPGGTDDAADDGRGDEADAGETDGDADGAGDGSDAETGPRPPDGAIVDGVVVNYPSFVDDAASVAGADDRIEYVEPETTFASFAGFEGDEASDDDLRIDRDLSGDAMTAFVAPVYDDGFDYHVFANEAFVAFADWHAVAFDGADPARGERATFVETTERAYYLRLSPSIDEAGVAVVDAPAGEVDEAVDDLTGIVVDRTDDPDRATAVPQATFTFERDADAGAVRIVHAGGDHLEGDHLFVAVGDERLSNPFDVETVRAGDATTVEAPDDATVRVVYDDGDRSEPLAADDR